MKNYFKLLVLLLITNSFAQTNFVSASVTLKNGNVLKGLIDYRDWKVSPDKILFKTTVDGNISEYNPEQLTAFKVEKDKYISELVKMDLTEQNIQKMRHGDKFVIEAKRVFLNVLVEGKINLYRYYNNRPHYFVSKDSSDEQELIYRKVLAKNNRDLRIIKQYIQQLQLLMNDCGEIKIHDEFRYTGDNFKKIIKKYNMCSQSDNQNEIYEKDENTNSDNFSVFIGGSSGRLNIKSSLGDLKNFDGGRVFKATIGLAYEINFNRNLNRWSLLSEISYNSYSGNFEAKNNEGLYFYKNFEFKTSYVNAQSQVRYKFNTSKSKSFLPFVNAGIGYNVVTNSNSTVEKVNMFSDNVREIEITAYSNFFSVAGIGVLYKDLSLELRYTFIPNIYTVTYLKGKLSDIGLVVAYKF